MSLSDLMKVDDDEDKLRGATPAPENSNSLSGMMQLAGGPAASSATFDSNMRDLSREDPMMNSYFKNNPVDVAKAMYNLKKSLSGISPALGGMK